MIDPRNNLIGTMHIMD
jgi:hypothetical protein